MTSLTVCLLVVHGIAIQISLLYSTWGNYVFLIALDEYCNLIQVDCSVLGQFTSVCDNRVISDVSDTGGICYEESLATDTRDWNDALLNCSNTNRRLARVVNEEMSEEIERITQDTDEHWIGLSRQDSNSDFIWSDGTNVSYTRWSSDHPIDGLNCVSVRGNSTEWYSRSCSEVKPYICETGELLLLLLLLFTS